MKLRTLSLLAVFCLSLHSPASVSANFEETEPDLVNRLLQDGWERVEEGVLQRKRGGGRVETFSYGEQGMRWTVRRLAERLRSLQREYRAHPSVELAGTLETLKAELARAEGARGAGDALQASVGPIESATAELTAGCEPTATATASAGPQSTTVPGAAARASVSFEGPCPGDTFAYAYSRATSGSTTAVQSQEEPRYGGTSLASSLAVSATGSLDCFAEAYARASIEDLSYESYQTSYTCTAGSLDSTPYGLPFAVPGTIKAADFDNGGEGVAYHEVTPHTGSSYRATEVDLYQDTVLRLEAGDWMQYTIDVETAGAYTLVAQVGTESAGGSFHVELDGVDVTGPVAVPVTGGWSRWRAAVREAVSFPAGRHALRFVADSWFDSFQSMRFVVAQAPFGGTPRTLPGTFKAVDFDEGGEWLSYHDNTAGCEGSCGYRTADVDRYNQWVYRTQDGEWLEYTVEVTTAGVYTAVFRVSSEKGGGTFHLELDGEDVTGPITMPLTGSLFTFQTVSRSGVSLPAGRHVLRLVIDDDVGRTDAGSFDTITIQP